MYSMVMMVNKKSIANLKAAKKIIFKMTEWHSIKLIFKVKNEYTSFLKAELL